MTNSFSTAFESFERSAFRLETLDTYSVEEEKASFAAYLAGDPLPPPNLGVQWTSFLEKAKSAGKVITRVRLIPAKLTPYLKYEFDWWYAYNAKAGENILVVKSSEIGKFVSPERLSDFWLFDDQLLYDLSYDTTGNFLGAELNENADELKERCLLAEELCGNGLPLIQFISAQRNGN